MLVTPGSERVLNRLEFNLIIFSKHNSKICSSCLAR